MSRSTKSDATTGTPGPRRRRGGQELPDSVQDRPEQNAGYDAAVREGEAAVPDEPLGFDDGEPSPEEREMREESVAPRSTPRTALEEIDERAEQDAINEVRRREKRG
jgi:hypothetical protein